MLTPFPRTILLLVALTACAKSNEAKPPVEAGPSPFGARWAIESFAPTCAEGSSTEVALGEVTETGFSAEDMLALAEGEHRETIQWLMPEGLELGPESGARELTIRIERASDRARAFAPDNEVIGHGARCWPWLFVDVVVTVQSAGGALNERFEAELYAADESVAYLAAISPALELAGDVSVARDAADFAASSYELRISFSEHGATGSLLSNWSREVQEPRLYWEETLELAHWGRAHCDVGTAYSVTLDDAVEVGSDGGRGSAKQAIDWMNAAAPIAIRWEGGGTTTGTLSFTPEDDGACVTTAAYSSEPFQDLKVRGELELRTEDGRLDARWPGWLGLNGNGVEGANVIGASFTLDGQAMPDSYTASTAELGFPEETRGGHTSLNVMCDLFLDENGGSWGTIGLTAYDASSGCDLEADPSCAANLTSTPLVRGTVSP